MTLLMPVRAAAPDIRARTDSMVRPVRTAFPFNCWSMTFWAASMSTALVVRVEAAARAAQVARAVMEETVAAA
jgi:hypothetical protein